MNELLDKLAARGAMITTDGGMSFPLGLAVELKEGVFWVAMHAADQSGVHPIYQGRGRVVSPEMIDVVDGTKLRATIEAMTAEESERYRAAAWPAFLGSDRGRDWRRWALEAIEDVRREEV